MVRFDSSAILLDASRDGTPDAAWITRPGHPLATRNDGPLAGLTFAVKDNIDVAGWPTTAGCPAFAYQAQRHASVVQRLLDHGATLVGKTNLDQFACGLNGTRSPYGAVPNAFDPRYISGGSSSGSAYVVASGQVDFALGTDTAGSGRVPAGLNNIVGLKPSRGLVSAHGVVPAAQSVDCVSIFASTVATAARVLSAAMAHDPQDPYSRALALADRPLPAAFRFGVPDRLEFFGDALARAAFDHAVAQLQALGGTPVTVPYAPLAQAADLLYDSALVAERHAAIRPFFDANEHALVEPVRSIVGSGRRYSAADLCAAQAKLRALGKVAAPMWDRIDVLLVPTAPTHYTIAQMRADPVALNRNLGYYTNFVNLLDYAALSVPSSMRADGLPFGITLIGPCGSDWQLAELGQRYHHRTGLAQGATGRPLPAPQAMAGMARGTTVKLAVVGAHLSGMPLNVQLTQRGATLVGAAETAPDYRLFALPGTTPPKPGLLRVGPGEGRRIALEIWDMPVERYGSFVALVASPLGIGTLTLADGSAVQGFVCEELATRQAEDISAFGGWRAYVAGERPHPSPPPEGECPHPNPPPEGDGGRGIDLPEVVEEVRQAFERYEAALVGNDVAVLDALFWHSPRTLRYGFGENLYGFDAIARYRAGQAVQSPPREILKTVITTYGRDFATANIEFRRADSARTGRQSQTWIRTADGWRVATAHVSLLQA